MRLRIDCAYDGSEFHGWASQPGLRTVQGVLEDYIRLVCRVSANDEQTCRLTVAGRTDAGVHASHQVCHVDIDESVLERVVGHLPMTPVEALEYRLKHLVDKDIRLFKVREAPEGFDARFSALSRTYVYRIADDKGEVHPALRHCVHRVRGILDIDSMNEVCASIIGLHDFGSFAICNEGGTTIREVKEAHWERSSFEGFSLEGGLVRLTIRADAFARSMVRSLVNACVQVGLRKRSLDWFLEALEHVERKGDTGPIAACGLTLEEVLYPEDALLASRAEQIRAKRSL